MARTGGLKGAARPLTSCEWSGQGAALPWPREYAGEKVASKGDDRHRWNWWKGPESDTPDTMQSYLEKRDSAKNLARFYSLRVLPNLFGEWSLQREWGRIGQAGQVRRLYFPSQEDAACALLKLETAKRQRGYWLRPEQLELF